MMFSTSKPIYDKNTPFFCSNSRIFYLTPNEIKQYSDIQCHAALDYIYRGLVHHYRTQNNVKKFDGLVDLILNQLEIVGKDRTKDHKLFEPFLDNNVLIPNSINLHGCGFATAYYYLARKIHQMRNDNQEILVVCQGKGNNNTYGVSLLRQALTDLETDLKGRIQLVAFQGNTGRMNIVVNPYNHASLAVSGNSNFQPVNFLAPSGNALVPNNSFPAAAAPVASKHSSSISHAVSGNSNFQPVNLLGPSGDALDSNNCSSVAAAPVDIKDITKSNSLNENGFFRNNNACSNKTNSNSNTTESSIVAA